MKRKNKIDNFIPYFIKWYKIIITMGLQQSFEQWISLNDMYTYDVIIKKYGNANDLQIYDTILTIVPSKMRNVRTYKTSEPIHAGSATYLQYLLYKEQIDNKNYIGKLEICIPIDTYNDLIELYKKIKDRLKNQDELPPSYNKELSSY